MSQVATILEAVASTFEVSKESILKKYTSINIPKKVQEAKMALIYVLREKASLTFRQIAKETNYVSGGSVNTIYQKAADLYEQNHAITEKINIILSKIENFAPVQENEALPEELTADTLEELTADTPEETPEVVSLEESPLSQPVIERDISNVLRTDPKPIEQAANQDDFLYHLDDYQRFEQEQDQVTPDTIQELSFETPPNDNPNKVTVKMDDETANFSTDSILNIVEFGSVELACYYSAIPEREVREMEKEGEIPPKSTQIAKEVNDNARAKLEETAAKKIKLLHEPLKKVLKTRNVSVSPESALFFAFLMFAFSMFMTTKSIKKDNEHFLDKLRNMQTELNQKP